MGKFSKRLVWMIIQILLPFWLYLDTIFKDIEIYNSLTYIPFEDLILKEEMLKINKNLEIKNTIADLTLSFFMNQTLPKQESLLLLSEEESARSFLLYFLAIQEIRKENFIKARSLLEESLKLNSNFDYAWNLLGYLQSNSNNFKEAEISFKKAVTLYPNHPIYRFNLSKTYFNLGKIQDALKEIDVSIRLKENYPEAYFLKGMILEEINKEEALKNYQIALEMGLDKDSFLIQFLNLAFQLNSTTLISQIIEKLQNKKKDIEILLLLLKIHLNYGEYNKAYQIFEEILLLPSGIYELNKEEIENQYEQLKILNCKQGMKLQNFFLKNQNRLEKYKMDFVKKILNFNCKIHINVKDPIVSPGR